MAVSTESLLLAQIPYELNLSEISHPLESLQDAIKAFAILLDVSEDNHNELKRLFSNLEDYFRKENIILGYQRHQMGQVATKPLKISLVLDLFRIYVEATLNKSLLNARSTSEQIKFMAIYGLKFSFMMTNAMLVTAALCAAFISDSYNVKNIYEAMKNSGILDIPILVAFSVVILISSYFVALYRNLQIRHEEQSEQQHAYEQRSLNIQQLRTSLIKAIQQHNAKSNTEVAMPAWLTPEHSHHAHDASTHDGATQVSRLLCPNYQSTGITNPPAVAEVSVRSESLKSIL